MGEVRLEAEQFSEPTDTLVMRSCLYAPGKEAVKYNKPTTDGDSYPSPNFT